MHELSDPMSPEEVKAAREAFGMTQREFAILLGLDGKNSKDTVRAWESGSRNPISGPARIAIRLLLERREKLP